MKKIKASNLEKKKNILLSNRASHKLIDFLINNSYNVSFTKDNPSLDKRISDHVDMSVFKIENKIVVAREVYDYYVELLKAFNYEIIKAEKNLSNTYPDDSVLNIFTTEKKYLHNSFTDKRAEKLLSDMFYEKILIKQGYANCSIFELKCGTILTSDYGVYKKTGSSEIDVNLLPQGGIVLEGYDTGFIGGSLIRLSEDSLIINGDLDLYSHSKELVEILDSYNIKYFQIKGQPITDIGGSVLLD